MIQLARLVPEKEAANAFPNVGKFSDLADRAFAIRK
jgi:hypothetical protein